MLSVVVRPSRLSSSVSCDVVMGDPKEGGGEECNGESTASIRKKHQLLVPAYLGRRLVSGEGQRDVKGHGLGVGLAGGLQPHRVELVV